MIEGRGLLVIGPSGAGKSALALDLIALSATLIADDVVQIGERGGRLFLSSPQPGAGLIEARGIGLLRTPLAGPAPLALVVDLGAREDARLPPPRAWTRFGVEVPLIRAPKRLHPAAIRAAVLSGGPIDPDSPVEAASLARAASQDQSS